MILIFYLEITIYIFMISNTMQWIGQVKDELSKWRNQEQHKKEIIKEKVRTETSSYISLFPFASDKFRPEAKHPMTSFLHEHNRGFILDGSY